MNQQEGDKKDRSQQSCCDSRLFPEDDCCANGYEDDAGQIGPEGPSRKKWRAQTGSEMGIDEMLNPKSHKRQGKEISPQFKERICLFVLLQGGGVGKNPRAATHGQGHESASPLISIACIANDPGNVQQHHKEKKHHSQHGCGRPGH